MGQVKSKQGTSLVPQLKLGPSAAPNLLRWLMEHILRDALEFFVTILKKHVAKSFFHHYDAIL